MPEKKSPLVVADTNVLVSALIGKVLRVFLDKLKQNKFELVFSEETYEELILVLKRPKFKKYINKTDIEEFKELLTFHSQLVAPKEKIEDCPDLKDNIFLECAIVKPVDYIVSGDPDLLNLNPFRGIPIIKPAEFLKLI